MITPTSEKTALPSSSPEQDLNRQLIEQFYENSIERYGIDSEQTRIFGECLSAYSAGAQ